MDNLKVNGTDSSPVTGQPEQFKKTKIFFSIMKEKMWLEEMALKGYRLTAMTMGIKYTFEKCEPKRIVYEIDRFDIPDSPTLAQIHAKEEFIALAKDMGWTELLHDETMNYYFCKELDQLDDYEELYSDYDSRKAHAEKFKAANMKPAKSFIGMALIGIVMLLLVATVEVFCESNISYGYLLFTMLYSTFCLVSLLFTIRFADFLYHDLLLNKEEWLVKHNNAQTNTKVVHKVFIRTNAMLNYLTRQSANGWQVTSIGSLTYTFTYNDTESYQYTLDSRHLTNRRLRRMGKKAIHDNKDLQAISYDWQIQSAKDAASLAWDFVCAYKNMLILYRTPAETEATPLNHKHKQPGAGIFTHKIGLFFLICILIGFVVGFSTALLLQ